MHEGAAGVILLDVDGVLLENSMYDSEWVRLAAQAFVPLLGGDPAAWAEAQDIAWCRVFDRATRRLQSLPSDARPSPADFWSQTNSEWIEEACGLMGVEPPVTAEERVDVAERALAYYFTNSQATFPGTGEALARLSRRFQLHTASGNQAFVVEGVLRQLAVRELVGSPFGSDLLGSFKDDGIEFYESILAAIEAPPERVIVVDDLDAPLHAARRLGIGTVKIGAPRTSDYDLVIETIASLPEEIGRLTRGWR